MSNRLVIVEEEALEELIRATESLNLAVTGLRRNATEQEAAERDSDHWELVEDAAPVTALEKEVAQRIFSGRGVEDGPPPLPDSLRFLAAGQRLTSRGGGAYNRAWRAWKSGFWARVALDTCTDYKREEELDIPVAHWIVVTAPGTTSPKRTTRKIDCLKLLKEAGQGQIWDCFPSLTELQIFCAGTQIDVPPLVRWRNNK